MGRNPSSITAMCLAVLLSTVLSGCSKKKGTDPNSGTVTGVINYLGIMPEEGGLLRAGVWTEWPAAGPPSHYSENLTGSGPEEFIISGLPFGTYPVVAVVWEPPGGWVGVDLVLGAYGITLPDDLVPDPVTVDEEEPVLSDIDILADWSEAFYPLLKAGDR